MNRLSALRDFLVIWAGQLISAVGSRLSTFALGIWVLQTTGSTTQFAMTYLAMDLPILLVSPFAGALIDRWDRRLLMMACDSLCAAAMAVLAMLQAGGHLTIWHVYLGVGLMSVCAAFHSPAFSATIPLMASPEQLPRVNGTVQTGNAIATILGPLLAGALVSTINLYGILTVDALTFGVAVAGLAISRIPRPNRVESDRRSGLLEDAIIGWRFVYERHGLMGLLLLEGFSGFVFSIAAVLITPLLLSFANPAMVGLQYAVGGVGLLLGAVAVTAFGAPRNKMTAILGLSFLCGVFLAIHGLRPSFTLVTVAGFVMFMSLPMRASLNASLWQRKVPADLQGRCFAMQQVLASAAAPMGYCLAGPLAERVFEPLLLQGGALSGSLGLFIGIGPGRGIGLMFILLGALLMLAATVAHGVSAIRLLDSLPDAVAGDGKNPMTSNLPATTGAGEFGGGLAPLPQRAQ